MVLDDGETFSCLGGCRIVEVPDEWTNDSIESALREDDDDGDINLDDLRIIWQWVGENN